MNKLSKIALISLMPFAVEAASIPMSFNFEQGGYEEGASVTGMFTGVDLNSDGVITSVVGGAPTGELTSFMLEFSGNSIVPAFMLDLSDVPLLVYELSGGPALGDVVTETLDVTDFSSGYTADAIEPGTVISPTFAQDKTTELLIVTPKDGGDSGLPDAGSSVAFLTLGLAGMAGAKRIRK